MLVSGFSCASTVRSATARGRSATSMNIGGKPSRRNAAWCCALSSVRRRRPTQSAGVRIGRTRVADVADAVVPPAQHAIRPLRRDLSRRVLRRHRHRVRRTPRRATRPGTAGRTRQAPARGRRDSSRRNSSRPVRRSPPWSSRSAALRPAATMLSVTVMRQRIAGAPGDAVAQGVQRARVDRSGGLIAGEMQCDHALCMAHAAAILPWSRPHRRSHAVPSAVLAPAAHQRGRDARTDRAAAGRGEHGHHGAADRPRVPLRARPAGDPRYRKPGRLAGAVRPDRRADPPPRRRARRCACMR